MQKTLLTLFSISLTAAVLIGGCKGADKKSDTAGGSGSAMTPADFLKEHKLLGKPVLIEFGMVGCELSGDGLSKMDIMQRNKLVEGLQYVRVEISADAKAVEQYYKDNSVEFPVIRDAKRKVSGAFEATTIPLFLLIDKFGNIRYEGAFPDEDLAEWSGILLAEKSDPGPDVPRLGVKVLDGPALLASTKLPALNGGEQALDQYAGPGGIMLLFADTSCPFSDRAMRELPGVARVVRNGAKIKTVVVNISDSLDKVTKYYDERSPGVPVVYDEGVAARMSWDVHRVPTVVLLDARHRIAYKGPAMWSDVGHAGEMALGLPPGTLKFSARGTKDG